MCYYCKPAIGKKQGFSRRMRKEFPAYPFPKGEGASVALSAVWVGMLLLSVGFGALHGSVGAVAAAAAEGASAAVTLVVRMLGGLMLWSGLHEVLSRAGALSRLSRRLRGVLGALYPSSRRDPALAEDLCANLSANLLGLGNAATPAGIRAAARLQKHAGGAAASDELCRLVVMNTASLQLLPATLLTLRASLGAADPYDILGAVWLSSLLSQAAGLLAERAFSRLR